MIKRRSRQGRHGERGYVLLVLLLSVALLSIGFTVMIQGLEFEIRRDREEELIHRGVQYSRAVRKFIKAFGRYPNSIDELESTNNIRFLRRRYKDPITGKDFKILHLMDLPGSIPMTAAASANLSSPQGSSSRAANRSREDAASSIASNDSDAQTSASPDESDSTPTGQTQSTGSNPSPQLSTQVTPHAPTQRFGGGPMVGVASLSKKVTIREFNKKNHYNEWQFVYDPSSDRGVLQMTPNQPVLRANSVNGKDNQGSLGAFGGTSARTNPADRAQVDSPSSP